MAFGLGQHNFPHTQTGGSKPARATVHRTPVSPRPRKSAKAPLTQSRVAQLLANPGTRATLPDAYLPPNLLAKRQMNQRLAQPVTPGSSMTEGALARQTNAAADVRYGQALGQARQVSRDVSDYYSAYLRELAAHQANVAQYQNQAVQQTQGLAQATGQLPAQGAATNLSSENQQVAGNAAAVRNALTGSFGAMLASQGANANTYASTLANVVGPGAKLQAQTRAGNNITSLLQQRGAFRQQTGDQIRQDEAKNVLATAIATGKEVANTPAAKGAVAGATEEAKQAAKYGYSLHDWRMLGPKGRATARAKDKGSSGDTVYSSGPFAGRTKSEIQGLSDAERTKLVDAYNSGKGKAKGKKSLGPYGVKPASTIARGALKDQVEATTTYAQAMKDQGIDRPKALKALLMGIPKSKDNPTAIPKTKWLAAVIALDKAYYGKVTRATLKHIHDRGYSVRDLGIPFDTGQPQVSLGFGGVSVPIPGAK